MIEEEGDLRELGSIDASALQGALAQAASLHPHADELHVWMGADASVQDLIDVVDAAPKRENSWGDPQPWPLVWRVDAVPAMPEPEPEPEPVE